MGYHYGKWENMFSDSLKMNLLQKNIVIYCFAVYSCFMQTAHNSAKCFLDDEYP